MRASTAKKRNAMDFSGILGIRTLLVTWRNLADVME
jgi:hypothetical protein